jgi:AAA+ superfamily predicted ATPase
MKNNLSADTAAPHDEGGPRLTIAFARSSSPAFVFLRRRLDALAALGSLEVARDAQGQEVLFELTLWRDLVPAARRIANLLCIVRAWRSTEVSLDGEVLSRKQQQLFIEKLERVRSCWLRHKEQGQAACRRASRLGCDSIRLEPPLYELNYGGREPPWFGIGTFNGERVTLDKVQLRDQLSDGPNRQLRLCPFFDAAYVERAIDELPETLSPGDSWTKLHDGQGKPAWLWPKGVSTPMGLHATQATRADKGASIRLGLDLSERDEGADEETTPVRSVPPTRYSDVIGQDAAVETVRDAIELPLRYPEFFRRLGATPRTSGLVLAGPPGTGKTLLARAVAGECGAHIEIVSGPSLLSMWLGQTEAALRKVFDRARAFAPSVVLFDEIDSIAPSRFSAAAQHDVSIVAQLLVLLDGLESRGQIFVLGTTNRPEQLDPALRRPGRLDQTLWLPLPDERGRAALFEYYLRPLKLAPRLDRQRLAGRLAALTPGSSGADIAFICDRAALRCVKEGVSNSLIPAHLVQRHFLAALPQNGVHCKSQQTG